MIQRFMAAFVWLIVTAISVVTAAETSPGELQSIQQQWAVANYQLKGDEQKKAFKQLLELTQASVVRYPEDAAYWIWDGIVKSTYAGVKGGLGALSFAKQSKLSLEKALELDASALQGSAYTSLGVLYHKVPGWPVAFGDDKKAKRLLIKALTLNPTGLDPNYFYGEYLADNGEHAQAQEYLKAASRAPARPGRELADSERQKEVCALLAKVDAKLAR